MVTKKKSYQPKRATVVVHDCTQREVIKRLSELIVGNGHPEDGLAFKVQESLKDREQLHKSLQSINFSLEQSNKNYISLLEDFSDVKGSLATFKAEILGEKVGENRIKKEAKEQEDSKLKLIADARAEKMKKLQSWGLLIAALSFAVMATFTVLNHFVSRDSRDIVRDTKTEVDYINTPVTNPRSGKTYLMPAGILIDSLSKEDSIKYRGYE